MFKTTGEAMILETLFDRRPSSDIDANRTTFRRPGEWTMGIVLVALSCGLGVAYAITVVGLRVINPLDVSWLIDDPATGYLGWAFFRQEPHLTLPLGWSNAIGYPLGEPIAYFDSIPLVATLCWIIRGLLPENFQYLGIYFVVCCILQFYFGYRISRRLCNGSRMAGVFGAAMFMTAPPFTWRASGHFSLISHWIILAALDQFLEGAERPSRGQIAWRGILCFIAGGISPYITAMTFLILSGTYLRTLLCQRNGLRRLTVGLSIALSAAIFSLLLFGFVRGADISQYSGADYDKYSMNLLAPINPAKYGALLLREQPVGQGQYEGYNYLGLGMLLTGGIALARKPSYLRALWSIEAVPAIGIFVTSLLLALSSLGTAGNFILWNFSFPRPLMAMLATLHASGRLFWPGYYLLFIGVIWCASRVFRGLSLRIVLAIALVIQFFDLAPLRAFIHQRWQESNAPLVSSNAAWHDLGRTQRHLIVVPPWQCYFSPGGYNGYAIFGRLALEQHMTVNSFYAGRYSNAQMNFFCNDQILQIRRDGLQTDSAYVFNKSMAADITSLKANGKYCRFVDQLILCSDVPGKAGPDSALSREVVDLHSGDSVSFSASNQTVDRLIGLGWGGGEPWGRWMLGYTAAVVFKLAPHPQRDVRIELSVIALTSSSHPIQRVDVQVNGQPLPQQTVGQPSEGSLKIVIPRNLIAEDGLVRLVFNLPDAVSPASLGLGADARELSIGVKQLRVEDSGD
jgi:hypothetical protein